MAMETKTLCVVHAEADAKSCAYSNCHSHLLALRKQVLDLLHVDEGRPPYAIHWRLEDTMTRIPSWLLAAIAIICPVRVCRAGVIQYSNTFDAVSPSYFHPLGLGSQTISTMRLESSGGYPAFTGDFQEDKQLRVTYSAPAGQRFVFNPPLDADTLTFTVWFGSLHAIASGAGMEAEGVSIEFAGAEGVLPSSASALLLLK